MARSVLLMVLIIGSAAAHDQPWQTENSKVVSTPLGYLREHPEHAKELEVLAAVVMSSVVAHEIVVHKELLTDALEHVTGRLRGSRAFPCTHSKTPTAAIADQPDGTAEDAVEVASASHGDGHESHGLGYDLPHVTWAACFAHVLEAILRPANMIKICVASAAVYVFCALREHAHQKAEMKLKMTDRAMDMPLANGEQLPRFVVPPGKDAQWPKFVPLTKRATMPLPVALPAKEVQWPKFVPVKKDTQLPKAVEECRDEDVKNIFREVMAAPLSAREAKGDHSANAMQRRRASSFVMV